MKKNTNIDKVISKLQQAKSEGHDKIFLSMRVWGDDYYIDDLQLKAWHYEEETDEEFEARVAAWQDAERIKRDEAKERKAKNEAREKKEYERLKKKWGS